MGAALERVVQHDDVAGFHGNVIDGRAHYADGRAEVVGSKVQLRLSAGDRLRIETPGGGGYGAA